MSAIEIALAAGATIISGVLGGWLGGRLALRSALQAAREQAALVAAANRDENRAERDHADLIARATERRKFLLQRIDRKIELLKETQSLLELCSARRGDPNSIRTAATLLGVTKALAAVVLEPIDQTRLILPFKNLLEPQDGKVNFDLGPAKAGLKHLAGLIDADIQRLQQMMNSPTDGEISTDNVVVDSSNP